MNDNVDEVMLRLRDSHGSVGSMNHARIVRLRATLAAAVLVLGCSDGSGPGTGPGTGDPTPFVASLVRATALTPAQVYVSLPTDSIPNGISAVLRHTRTGTTATVPVIDGGFDPVSLSATAGDTVAITVELADGAAPITYAVIVPKVTRPVIVRTYPPKQKRDVPLNASMVVVFSTPMAAASLSDGALRLRAGDADVVGDLEFTDATHTSIRFVPQNRLDEATDYELIIGSSFRDLEGNSLESGLTVFFRTGNLSLSFSVDPVVSLSAPPDVPAVRVLAQVIARYPSGALATDFEELVTIELEDQVNGRVTGVTTLRAEKGVATFLNLYANTIGAGHRLRATTVDSRSALSAPLDFGGSVIIEQSGKAVAGITLAPVVVHVLDAAGNHPTGYHGPVTLSLSAGAVPTLSGTTTVDAVDGRAIFSNVQINGSGEWLLVATSAGVASAGSRVTLEPVSLGFTSSPVTVMHGTPLAAVIVTARDSRKAVRENFTGEISLALGANPGGAVLTGSTTVHAVNGVATFSNLLVSAPGGGYTLVASRPCCSDSAATSLPFDIASATLTFITQPTSGVAGTNIAPAIRVAATVGSGQTQTSFSGSVTIDLREGPTDARIGGTLTATAVNGIATFSDVTLDVAGNSFALTARGEAVMSATSASFSMVSPWVTLAPMPTPRIDFGTAVIDGKLYVVGGRTAQGTYVATVEAYDPLTNSWSTRAPLRTARSGVAVAVLNGILYAAGGRDGSGDYPGGDYWNPLTELKDLEAYDPATNTWTSRRPFSPIVGEWHSLAELGGVLYLVSAWPQWDYNETTLLAYDPASDQWTSKEPMRVTRTGSGAVAAGSHLYALGGFMPYLDFDTVTNVVERYDPLANNWASTAPMPLNRRRMGIVVANGMIYAIGGWRSREREIASIDAYDPLTSTWTVKPAFPVARRAVGAGFINGVLYVVASTPQAYGNAGGSGTETYGYTP